MLHLSCLLTGFRFITRGYSASASGRQGLCTTLYAGGRVGHRPLSRPQRAGASRVGRRAATANRGQSIDPDDRTPPTTTGGGGDTLPLVPRPMGGSVTVCNLPDLPALLV